MDIDVYHELAMRTKGRDDENMEFNDAITCWGLGVAGEAGEVADYIKKVRFHDKTLDRDILIKEMGDVLWYLAALADELDISLSYVATQNILKLQKRYPNGFTFEASNNRSV